ncbi:MAG: ParA family protein [Burkholderiales bacterium]|jgi:chromosome partitioning protein
MRTVVFNQKGGVGKSTITVNLAAVGAARGRRTLVLDLDSQGNSTRYLLGEAADAERKGVADLFEQSLKFSVRSSDPRAFVTRTPFERLDLIASDARLDEIHSKLESRYKIFKLRDALDALADDYDDIWIDTPPALNFYTRSALIAARGCLIPFDCDDFSRRALYGLMEAVDEIRADHNESLEVTGIVVNQFQPRANLPQRVVQELVDEGLPVLQPYLSQSVRIRESHERALPMAALDPRHKLAEEFEALYDTVAEASGGKKARSKR